MRSAVKHPLAGLPAVLVLAMTACSQQAAPAAPAASEAPVEITPTPTSEPLPTSTPVPTETPKPVVTAPLTGLPLDDAADANRAPIMVKLGNSDAERPQAGLAQADVVYETVTEGGITRYAAIFQSHDASTVGPVRSARLSDLQIAPEYGAVLAHVGASGPVMGMIRNSDVLDLDQFFWPAYYHRTTDRIAPYNVYTSTANLRDGALARGFAATNELASYDFDSVPPAPGNADVVTIDFARETRSQYLYDAAKAAYRQVENGTPTTDSVTGEDVSIANLVVQYVPVLATNIIEDANGSRSLDYRLNGQGKAQVFHDGTEIDGTWSRNTPTERTAFTDSSGEPIKMARGATWIALVGIGAPVSVRPSAAPG